MSCGVPEVSDLVAKLDQGVATRRRHYSLNVPDVGSVGLIAHPERSDIAKVPMGSVLMQPSVDWSPVVVPIATYAAFALRHDQSSAAGAGRPVPARSTDAEVAPAPGGIFTPRYIGVFPPESTSEPEKPDWWTPVTVRVREIASLREDWDSYDAAPVDRRNIVAALNFLLRVVGRHAPAPGIVPLPDGSVQLEWHRGGMDVEVEFTEGVDQGLYFRHALSGEWEGPAQAGFEEFDIARRLIGD